MRVDPSNMVDWSVFGRHEAYGNGLKRAKLRGWIYGVVAVAGALALASRDLGPSRQPMACATLVVYWWGAVLHLVPFTSGEGYCAALAVDFCVITSVYTAHVAVYCGPSPTTALSLSMSAVLVASMASAVFAGRDIQYRRAERHVRSAFGVAHTLLLSAVEWSRCDEPWLGATVVVLKLFAFCYFFFGGRIDAPTHWTFATVPGYWDVHDNFHVIVLVVHAFQVLAVGRQAPPHAYDHLCVAGARRVWQ